MTTPREAAQYLAREAGISLNGVSEGVALHPDSDISEDAAPVIPPFPEAAWTGLFREYRDIVGPTTEAPDVFHYFGFATAFGATLGRRRYVYHAVKLFPNFYVVLVGRSGLSRKDTARSRARRLMAELNEDQNEDSKFIMLPGISSAEGLLEKMSGDGKVVVVQAGELLGLVAKAKKESSGNLVAHLTELYDCQEKYTLPTRNNPVTATRIFISLLAGTTPQWLRSSLGESDAYGGFANRFIYAFGEPKEPMPFPPRVDPGRWERLKGQINEARLWAGANETELDVDSRAIDLFSDWYSQYHPRASADGLLPVLAVRFQSFAWKLGLLYAAQEQAPILADWHLAPALAVVDWLWQSNQAAFADFTQHGRELEDAILQRLRDSETGFIAKRELYRPLRISASELEKAIEPLTRLGVVQAVQNLSPNGRKLEGYEILH